MINKPIRKKTSFGWLVVYTKNMYEDQFVSFKQLLAKIDPSKGSWMILPSEWVDRVEYIPRFSLKAFVRLIVTKIQWWLYAKKDKK